MTKLPNDCVDPAAVTADDHLVYARGEAGPAVAEHMDRCPSCSREAAAYAAAERVLHAALYRRSCPDSIILGEYALDLLDPESRTTVAQHLVLCTGCLRESRSYTSFLSQPDAPPKLGAVERLRRLMARPVMPEPVLSGMRGAADGDSTTYEAEGVRLTVSVQRTARPGAGSILVGLLEQIPESGAVATLYLDDAAVGQEAVDDLGNFLFSSVRTGTYRVEVTVPPSLVVVDGIAVA
jgi:hypothetical protein